MEILRQAPLLRQAQNERNEGLRMTPGEGLAMTISYVFVRSGATPQSQLKADVGCRAEIATLRSQ